MSDLVTVSKEVRLVFSKPVGQTSSTELITAMVGRKLDRIFPPKAGHSKLCKAIFGIRASKGEVFLHDSPLVRRNPSSAIRHGLGSLTENRKHEGLIIGLSVRNNIALPSLKKHSAGGIIQSGHERVTSFPLNQGFEGSP